MIWGIPSIALFPKTEDSLKSELGEEAVNPNNLICRTVKAVKKACPDIAIYDVALDPYTIHGHDGVLDTDGYVENDRTVEMLVAQSKTLADAGCDIIALSDMMDGRIGAIRNMLEDNHYQNMLIMAYAAKYASLFMHCRSEMLWAQAKSWAEMANRPISLIRPIAMRR